MSFDVVYKFLAWDDYEPESNKIITERKIKMSNSKSWGADYPEWKLPFDWDSVSQEQIYEKVYERATIEVAMIGIEKLRVKDVTEHAENLMKKVKFWDEENQISTERDFFELLNSVTGAFCTTTNWDNSEMWEKWGHLGQGYCVGLNVKELRKIDMLSGLCDLVNYYPPENIPSISPISSNSIEAAINEFRIQLFSIPDRYSFEKEFRFTKINSNPDGTVTKPFTEEERIVDLPIKCYSSITLGNSISDSDKNSIINSAKISLPKIPIYSLAGGNRVLI